MAKRELMSGNVAMAESAIRAGCNFFASYPITPQTTLLEYMSTRMFEVGREFIQAESEIGAINMVMGAAAAGGRAFTATAGMAVSLMMETLSYLCAAKLPSVVVNIQRTGAGAGGITSSQTAAFTPMSSPPATCRRRRTWFTTPSPSRRNTSAWCTSSPTPWWPK